MRFYQTKALMHNRINRARTPPIEWEKIFTCQTPEKALVYGRHKKLKQFNSKIINKSIFKWAIKLRRPFPKRDIQMANGSMKKCSASLVIGKMKIQGTMRDHLTPVTWAALKRQQGRGRTWREGTPVQCWWERKFILPLWKAWWRFLRKQNY